MRVKRKRLAISAIIVFIFVTAITLAATLYPYAVVTFSGIEMVKNGSTTQGFVDITLKKVNTPGISFCLEYDQTYIALSDVINNQEIENPTSTGVSKYSFNIEHTYFEQNTEAFPAGSFRDSQIPSMIGVNMPIIGIADANPDSERGRLIMNFLPTDDADMISEHIEWVEKDNNFTQTILAESQDLRLGRLSFKIKDPSAFSKLTEEELDNLIKVVPFSNMITLEDSAIVDDTGIHISYVDDEGNIQWYSREENNIDYEIDITAKLSDVQPDIQELTVSSYEIYNTGTVQDLLDFINEKMSKVILTYADNSKVPAMFEWTEESVSSITWDPLGGNYVITQKYNTDSDSSENELSVTVMVNVEPVTLTALTTDKADITYLYGSDNFPQVLGELELPQKAKPVLDKNIPNGGIAELNINWYSLEGELSQLMDLPADFSSGDPGDFTFIGHLDSQDENLSDKYPWLTASYPLPEIKVLRHVVTDEEDMPKTLVVDSAVTDENGMLTIVVSNSDGSAIPDGTAFSIKLPDGDVLDSTILGSRYTVTIADGTAKIEIDPDIAVDAEKKLAQFINLGDRAGEFEISSREPDKNQGDYTTFSPAPRRNTYLPSASGSDYEFDYSDLLSALFPVNAGVTLPTTVTLPISTDRIGTVYDGYTGDEAGSLETFTVDSWTVIDGDISTPGSVVTVTGRLADAEYTNYGAVFNDGNYNVVIKYLVCENENSESIEDIPDFVYNTQQVGYDYDRLQTKTFTVKNTGLNYIYGLTANISVSAGNGKEAFVLTKELVTMLDSGDSAEFDITTKIGLPVGEYVSTVSIMSNNGVLDTFNITFVVTENPVYDIDISVNDENFGTAKTGNEQYTAEAGETITITAEPEVDCEFTGWTVTDGAETSVEFDDPSAETTTFIMPEGNVNITANFKEMLGAKLRATELYVKNVGDPDTFEDTVTTYDFYDETWTKINFDPVKREYYVAVPNDIENVELWFKLREEAKDATITVTNEHDAVTDSIAVNAADTEEAYNISAPIALVISPTENLVKLNLTKTDTENHPDEGEVTRSYTIHIYRKKAELMTFNYGNSPYGLIMRDSAITDKDAAKQAFVDNGNMFTDGNTPVDATVGSIYLAKAWESVNYDFDDSALFVVNTSSFTDSGYKSVTNSIGGEVTTVSKSITVNLLTEETPSLQNGSSDDFVYTDSETIDLPSSGEITQLMGKRIRPDIYELTYSFTDFDGSTVYIKKPVIILPTVGDINISTAADTEDVSRILHRFSVDIADNYNVPDYNAGALFKFRVCDVNRDGNLNAVDANNIRANILNPFYANLTEGGDG